MPKRVYIAGASAEHRLVRSFADRLPAERFHIASPWWLAVADYESRGRHPNIDVPLDEARQLSEDMFEDIRAADIFRLLIPRPVPASASRGCWVELGIALALGVPSYVSGYHRSTIYSSLAARRFDEHDQAYRGLTAASGSL